MRDDYTRPPWETHGSGLVLPCLVPADKARVAAPFSVVQTAGYTVGALLYVQYVDPVPGTRHELIWISSLVRCTDPSYEVPAGWGPLYYVARNYVDDIGAVEAGRAEWGLPRSAAHFTRRGSRVHVEGEDGTELTLSFRTRGFTFPAPTRLSTVQTKGTRAVRLRARGRAQVQLASWDLEHFVAGHRDWESFHEATFLPGLASHLKSFSTTLEAPEAVPRAMDSLRPAALPF